MTTKPFHVKSAHLPLAREIDTGAYLVAYHLVHRKDL